MNGGATQWDNNKLSPGSGSIAQRERSYPEPSKQGDRAGNLLNEVPTPVESGDGRPTTARSSQSQPGVAWGSVWADVTGQCSYSSPPGAVHLQPTEAGW